jgi:Tol biopolymer transport system component
MPAGGFTGTPPSPAAAQSKESYFFDWASNNEFYFDGNVQRVSIDGKNKTPLFTDPAQHIFRAIGCPIGRYIVFVWQGHPESSKTNIWRIDADGENPRQLSHGIADVAPYCSLDAHEVYYADLVNGQLMRVPVEGGDSEIVPGTVIPGMILGSPVFGVSRDGRFLAFVAVKGGQAGETERETGQEITKVALVNLDSGSEPVVRLLKPNPRIVTGTTFTPDGKSLVYVIRENGADNLWLHPLDGTRGRQITNFSSDTIQIQVFSPDGKILGVMRSHTESDVVLLRDIGTSTQ